MTLKHKAEETIRKFWEVFASREGDVEKICMQYIHEDYVGYGTEPHEVWYSKEDFRKQLLHELEFAPDPVSITHKSIKTMVSGDVAVCVADMLYRFELNNKKMEIDPFRLVMTLQETDDGIKFLSMASISFDHSIPESVPWPGLIEPKKYDDVTILFTDFVGFSEAASQIPAKKLVHELNDIFSAFDDISKHYELEKVKTIGDAYMAVSGVRPEQKQHATKVVAAGIEMIEFLKQRNDRESFKWKIRVGVHSGPVVAGVVGKQRLSFDVWGSSVNLANQMEQKGEPGYVNISASTYELVKDSFKCSYRGKIEVKSHAPVDMYLIDVR